MMKTVFRRRRALPVEGEGKVGGDVRTERKKPVVDGTMGELPHPLTHLLG
ncbi:hypothetical protein [Alkalicoccus urumqiensis]|nr:hypothetical protein [Alkalicoccus urumqiensis]